MLADLETRLKAALRPVCPTATFAYEDDGTTLAVEYHVQPFMIHTVSKNGEIAAKAREERGPNRDGFRLTLDLRDGPLLSQMVLPARLRMSRTGPRSIDAASNGRSGESPRYVYVGLAYGHYTDRAVLKAIKAAVADFAKAKASWE